MRTVITKLAAKLASKRKEDFLEGAIACTERNIDSGCNTVPVRIRFEGIG
jgi:hypothetical protein